MHLIYKISSYFMINNQLNMIFLELLFFFTESSPLSWANWSQFHKFRKNDNKAKNNEEISLHN